MDEFKNVSTDAPALRTNEELGAGKARIIEIDFERYQAVLDELDGMPDQKEALIRALWSVIVNFADLGFGVHPVQQVCGQPHKGLAQSANLDSDGGRMPLKPANLTTRPKIASFRRDQPEGRSHET